MECAGMVIAAVLVGVGLWARLAIIYGNFPGWLVMLTAIKLTLLVGVGYLLSF